jgi:putative ABC transport system permease protein
MDAFLRDLALAVRLLRRRAAFSALAITVLALAIGANSAIFSVVEGVLLRPPAVEDPGRLVFVWERDPGRTKDRNVVGPYNFVRWRERARSFTDLAGFISWQGNLGGEGGRPERLQIGITTGNLFALLGARPFVGRALNDADSKPSAPDVAVLSEGFWRRRFAGDFGVVGRSIVLNGRPTTVVGVMPQSFQVPAGVSAWTPIQIGDDLRNARGRWMTVVARLAPQATLEQAREEMTRLASDLERENPQFDTGWSTSVFPLHADLVRDVRPALVVLMGAVALLLLVACANVANLLLARAVGREREVAVRSALGASPSRLVRQLLTESLLLALTGGVAGLVLGVWVLQGLVAMLPAEVRLMSSIGLNPSVVAFTTTVSLLCAILFGLVPALQQARPTLVPALKEGGRTRGASRGQRRVNNALVVAEIALSLVLTAGTGVLLRSFWRLAHVDPGFRAENVLTVPVDLPRAAYGTAERQTGFIRDVVQRLSRLPGAVSAGAVSWAPMGNGSATDFRVLDRPAPLPGQEPVADVRMVTPGLFRTMGIPVLMGRDFGPQDVAGRPTVVIVNRALADEFWPGQSALGRRIAMEWGRNLEAEVVGVVGDVRLRAMDTAPRATLYWAQEQQPNNFMTLMVRTSVPPRSLASAVRGEIAALDRELPPGEVRTLEEIVEGSLERQRFLLRLLGAFGALALLLAAVGVYGVVSYSVVERIPEVGVRLAVGASPSDIVRLVLRDGLTLGAVGVAIGLALAAAGSGLLESLLFEIGPRDPASLVAVALLLLAATAAAAWLPARRAGRIDPIEALRAE